MAVDLAAQITIGGELADQHFQVVSCNAIGISVEGIPRTSDRVVNDNVASGEAAAKIKIGGPGIGCGLDRGYGRLTDGGIGRALQSDGDPAVIDQVGIYGKQKAVDPVRCRSPQSRMVKCSGGIDVSGVHCIP